MEEKLKKCPSLEEDYHEERVITHENAVNLLRQAGAVDRAMEVSTRLKEVYIESAEKSEKSIMSVMSIGNFCTGLLEYHAQRAIRNYEKAGDPRAQMKPQEIIQSILKRLDKNQAGGKK